MRFALAFLLAASLFLATGTPALAASSKTTKTVASDPVSNATVNLYCRLKAGKVIYSPSGSGVFVSDRGIILTNAHVAQYFMLAAEKGRVTGWCSVRTGSPAEETYNADILYIPPTWLSENVSKISEKRPTGTGENDFALLYVTSAKKGALPAKFPSLPIATAASIVQGAQVTVAGYPVGDLDFSAVRNHLSLTKGTSTISSVQGFGRNATPDAITVTATANETFGISGGPVVDQSNGVMGLIVAKSTSKTDLKLRAISLPYIDAMLRTQSGLSLASMLASDLAARAAVTKLMLPTNIVSDLAKGLRSKK